MTARDIISRNNNLDSLEEIERSDISFSLNIIVGPEILLDKAANEVEEIDIFELTSTLTSESESELYDNTVIDKSRKNLEKKALPRRGFIKWQKLFGFLNIYISLYLAETAKEFSTVINSNIFAKKLKYK